MKAELGMTVTIFGNQIEILESLKKQMKRIVELLRHMKLKVHKVKLDQELLNSMSETMRNHCYLNNN